METLMDETAPITRTIVEHVTRSDTREMNPRENYEWMRCQIGRFEIQSYKNGHGMVRKEQTFTLRAFGSTWERALRMWKKLL